MKKNLRQENKPGSFGAESKCFNRSTTDALWAITYIQISSDGKNCFRKKLLLQPEIELSLCDFPDSTLDHLATEDLISTLPEFDLYSTAGFGRQHYKEYLVVHLRQCWSFSYPLGSFYYQLQFHFSNTGSARKSEEWHLVSNKDYIPAAPVSMVLQPIIIFSV